MTLQELKSEVQKYQYIEDTNIIDIALASIIATRLKVGEPIWLVIIGASSGGKSQILRPLALTDAKFLHRVDDLTENTFLSGMKASQGKDGPSLLTKIGPQGMIVISDLTLIFSKNQESMNAILSQFRMIYDGEMTKFVGNSDKPITWKGYLGVLAGSTPTIYANFEKVADMGERFIYYRMKDYSPQKATELALGRKLFGSNLDNVLANLYSEYIKDVIINAGEVKDVSDVVKKRIIEVAVLAEKIRTPVNTDWRGEKINKIPISAMPMRVALQLVTIAKSLQIMRGRNLDENDLHILDWCAYSLANEEKRRCLNILAGLPYDTYINTGAIADRVGLDTDIVQNILQNMMAVGLLNRRTEGSRGFIWTIKDEEDYNVIRRINDITSYTIIKDRELTHEEKAQMDQIRNQALDSFGED